MNIDPGLQVAVFSAVEVLINKALDFDPGSRYAIGRLQGKVLAVELTQPHITIYVVPEEQGLRLQSIYDGEVTTRLKGSPLALLSLMKSEQVNLADTGVEVFGSTGFLIELQSILQQLDIDWEEAITSIVGDVAGHQIGNSINAVKQWLGERKHSFDRMFGEFLTEEIQATPSSSELSYFYQQVDELRLGVDRASVRIQQILQAKSSSPDSSKNNRDASEC